MSWPRRAAQNYINRKGNSEQTPVDPLWHVYLCVATFQEPLVLHHLYEVVTDCRLMERVKINLRNNNKTQESVNYKLQTGGLWDLELSWVKLPCQSEKRLWMALKLKMEKISVVV